MSSGRRVAIAVILTIVALALGAAYPLAMRGAAWLDAVWQHPWALLGLVVVPLVWWWGSFGQDRRKPRLRIGTIAPLLAGPRGVRSYLRDAPGVLRAVALIFLLAAVARPVNVLHDESGDEKGIDIALVLDLSGSMRAILDADPRDIPGMARPAKNQRMTRLDTAKAVITDFISRRKTDRIGVVVFGKAAYVLSPPTLDYYLLTQLVSKMSFDVIDGDGTAIGDAIGTAVARLRRSDARSKAIILLTDGDVKGGSISPEYATHLAQETGAKIYTVQIGSADLVDIEDGLDFFGQPHYRKVSFPVNPELLKRMSGATGGESFIATDGKALVSSMHSILDRLEKTRFEASRSSFEELFQLLLMPGVLLVGLDALLRAWLLRRFP